MGLRGTSQSPQSCIVASQHSQPFPQALTRILSFHARDLGGRAQFSLAEAGEAESLGDSDRPSPAP